MTSGLEEANEIHTRLLKCALEVEASRAYWSHTTPGMDPSPHDAFSSYWFGAKSLARVKVLLTNLRARYDAFPAALRVLHDWRHMQPDTRALICHWHLQLSDPLYRSFTGEYLVQRRERLRPDISRDLVVKWVAEQGPGRWTAATRIQFASKLLSAAKSAGLVGSIRDPRPLTFPRVGDGALTYVTYLLREVAFEGTPLDNAYLRSVGMDGKLLEDRLRALPALRFHRQGELAEFGWQHDSLEAWAHAAGLLELGGDR
jgi:hypothetical protein